MYQAYFATDKGMPVILVIILRGDYTSTLLQMACQEICSNVLIPSWLVVK